MRRETAEQHHRLALDHAAGQDDRVAVLLNELFDRQRKLRSLSLCGRALARRRTILRSFPLPAPPAAGVRLTRSRNHWKTT